MALEPDTKIKPIIQWVCLGQLYSTALYQIITFRICVQHRIDIKIDKITFIYIAAIKLDWNNKYVIRNNSQPAQHVG